MASTTQQPDVQAATEGNAAFVKGAYWPSWNAGTFPSSDIKTTLFTHIYYAFLIPDRDTYTLELSELHAALLRNFNTGLPVPVERPRVKTLISIGGASDTAATIFANMASTVATRKSFIDSSIKVARNFGFDGLDLDWQFPNNPKQMEEFSLLLQEWRAAVTIEARATDRAPLLLTAAVYFAPDFLFDLPRSYPAQIMAQNLDWINAMCYDYHGAWDRSATGAPAAFFDPYSNINSNYGLRLWIQAGMPSNKLIMGLSLFGKTWELSDPEVNGIRASAVGLGPGDAGILTYHQVKEFNRNNNATVVYDMTTVSTYSYSGTSWVGYDNVQSTNEKIRLAQGLGLRGYFFWALGQDSDWEISTQGLDDNLCRLYQPLHKAALDGDWESAEKFLIQNSETAGLTQLNQKGMTILHVAANMGHSEFIRKFLRSRFFDQELLTKKDDNGFIALHCAASSGSLSAIKSLVSEDHTFNSTQIQDKDGLIPLHTAINNKASREVIWYLAKKTTNENLYGSRPFSGVNGADVIISLVHAAHYDICLYLFNRYRDLADASVNRWKYNSYSDLLLTLVHRQSEFPSGSKLSLWERCICQLISIDPPVSNERNLGAWSHPKQTTKLVIQRILGAASKHLSYIVPGFKHSRDEKYKHKCIMQLLQAACTTMSNRNVNFILLYFKERQVHFEAAENGGTEIIRAFMEHFPVIMDDAEVDSAILIRAVQHRQVNIFNIMMEKGVTVKFLPDIVDEKTEENVLHIAARLAPYVRLSSVACPALQMQRELQWFKEVEKFVPHKMKISKNKMENNVGLIPRELFTTAHKDLVRDAERWMKETANSCLVVATLILTVVFAVAFTIPGGNINGTGIPLLLRRTDFVIFVASDAVGMFSSATSILMFLSILTARYKEEDFLHAIPKRLMLGLTFLLIAITSMTVTFGVAVYMILHKRFKWVIYPIVGLTCFPIGIFVMLQLPLFFYMLKSTYGSILKPMKGL